MSQTSQFVIEDNIPIPERTNGPGREIIPGGLTDTILKMKPGQSLFFAGTPTNRVGGKLAAAKRRGAVIVARAENGGTRIWLKAWGIPKAKKAKEPRS